MAPTARLGSGDFSYEVADGWAAIPEDWGVDDVGGVAVDADDRVYVFNRSTHPMIVLDRAGALLGTWGEGVFPHPHAVSTSPAGTLFCTDDGDHTVRECSTDGTVLRELGTPGQASPYMSGRPFCQCTHTALSPDGELYVSDGYGNARVHKYSPDGELMLSWGSPGVGPGEFNLPHNITCDAAGRVYVADRENHRIQIFDGDGRLDTIWTGMHRPSGLYTTPDGALTYVGEAGPTYAFNRNAPNLGPRVSIWDGSGELVARLELCPAAGLAPGQFLSPHGIAVDSHGDVYVGEVSATSWSVRFPDLPRPARLRSLQKLVRVQP